MRTGHGSGFVRGVGTAVVAAGLCGGGCQSAPSATPQPAAQRLAGPATAPAAADAKWLAGMTPRPGDPAATPHDTSPEAAAQMAAAFAQQMKDVQSAPAAGDPREVQFDKPAPPPAAGSSNALAGGRAATVEPYTLDTSADFKARPDATPAVAAPAPVAVPAGASLSAADGTHADAAQRRLAARVRADPQDPVAQLDALLYGLVTEDPTIGGLASVDALQPEDREMLAAVFDGLTQFRAVLRRDPTALPNRRLAPLLDAAERLESQADLAVTHVTLCRRVEGFGAYEPFPSRTFVAGRENAAIVYCEVEHFRSAQNARRQWEAKMTQQVSLYTASGTLAWSDRPTAVDNVCGSRRHDFFLYDTVHLPSTLTPGPYVLKVSVEDQLGHRFAEAPVSVSFVARTASPIARWQPAGPETVSIPNDGQ